MYTVCGEGPKTGEGHANTDYSTTPPPQTLIIGDGFLLRLYIATPLRNNVHVYHFKRAQLSSRVWVAEEAAHISL